MHNKGFGSKVAYSFLWVAFERIGFIGIQFFTMMILSRILSPSIFGVIGILTIFIAISTLIVDCLGGAVIGKKNICEIDYSTLFTYNIAISLLVYLLLFIFSTSIANFYNNFELKIYIRILSLSFVFYSFGIVHLTRLIRNFEFKKLAIISILSQLFSALISIVLALRGFGVWALILMQVLQSLFQSLLAVIVDRNFLKIEFSWKSFKWQMSFGGYLLVSNFFQVISVNIFSSFIGKIYSSYQTGLYTQGFKIQNLPVSLTSTITDKTIFPILSKIDNKDEIKQIVCKISKYVYLIASPFFVFMIIMSDNLVTEILGVQWYKAGEVLKILSFAGFPLIIKSISRNVIKSSCKTKLIFRMELMSLIFTVLAISVSSFFTFKAVIWSVVISSWFSCFISIYFVSIILEFTVKEQIVIFLRSVYISILIGLSFYFVMDCFTFVFGIYKVILVLFMYFILYFLFLLLLKKKECVELYSSVIKLKKG